MSNEIFDKRREKHDKIENVIMDKMRPYTDRKHLPDRRVSFSQIPCSWDMKTNVFVEDNSYDEYWRLYLEGEPVFIVYINGDGDEYGDGKLYADWIFNIDWSGPFQASKKSTCGDDFYRISGGRLLEEFLIKVGTEIKNLEGEK